MVIARPFHIDVMVAKCDTCQSRGLCSLSKDNVKGRTSSFPRSCRGSDWSAWATLRAVWVCSSRAGVVNHDLVLGGMIGRASLMTSLIVTEMTSATRFTVKL